MKLLDKLNLETWWGILLYLGVLTCVASLFFDTDFIEEKHLFGLGIGFILIGLSNAIAYRHYSEFKPANAYTGGPGLLQWRAIKHSVPTLSLFIIGLLLSMIFGTLIVIGLLK